MEKNISKREKNKTLHKEALLEAAEKLFVQKGFEGTSIDDVAREAKLTKRTLYQYFLSKEDLFFAVAMKGGRLLTDAYEAAFERGKTALDKIRLGNEAYLQFYKEYLGMFRLLNYQPANMQNCLASPHFQQIAALNANRMRHYANLVEEGYLDKSINPAFNMKNAVFFAFFSAFSLLYTVSSTDKTVWEMMGIDESEFLKFSFELFTNALK